MRVRQVFALRAAENWLGGPDEHEPDRVCEHYQKEETKGLLSRPRVCAMGHEQFRPLFSGCIESL